MNQIIPCVPSLIFLLELPKIFLLLQIIYLGSSWSKSNLSLSLYILDKAYFYSIWNSCSWLIIVDSSLPDFVYSFRNLGSNPPPGGSQPKDVLNVDQLSNVLCPTRTPRSRDQEAKSNSISILKHTLADDLLAYK